MRDNINKTVLRRGGGGGWERGGGEKRREEKRREERRREGKEKKKKGEGSKFSTNVFGEASRSNTPKLLHVSTDTQQETKMNTEGTNIGTSLTAHPEDGQVTVLVKLNQFAVEKKGVR